MKKFLSAILVLSMLFSICVLPAQAVSDESTPVQSVEQLVSEVQPGSTSTMVLDGVQYTYTCYSDPVDYMYDGHSKTLLGVMEVRMPAEYETFSAINPNTALYTVYDYGITEKYADMSLPYFITSVAKGESVSESKTASVSFTLNAKLDSEFPTAAGTTIFKALKGTFELKGTATYTTTITVTRTGPTDPGTNCRTFYYEKGFNKHSIEVREQLYNDYTGIYATNWYEGIGYEPVCRSFSEDTYVS